MVDCSRLFDNDLPDGSVFNKTYATKGLLVQRLNGLCSIRIPPFFLRFTKMK